MATLNLADASDMGPTAEKESQVRAVIFDAELGESQKGQEKLDVTWKVTAPESVEGHQIWDTWMLEGRGAGFTADKLSVLKPELLDDLADQEVEFEPEDLFGLEARLNISVREYTYQGEERKTDEVDDVLPIEDESEEEESFVPSG